MKEYYIQYVNDLFFDYQVKCSDSTFELTNEQLREIIEQAKQVLMARSSKIPHIGYKLKAMVENDIEDLLQKVIIMLTNYGGFTKTNKEYLFTSRHTYYGFIYKGTL